MIRSTGKWFGMPEEQRKPSGPPTADDFKHLKTEFESPSSGREPNLNDQKPKAADIPASRKLTFVAAFGERRWGA